MDDAAGLLCPFFLQNAEGVLRRVSGVNDERHVLLPRQLDLSAEPVMLNCLLRFIVMIVETDLADSHNAGIAQMCTDVFQHLFRHGTAVARVNAQRCEEDGRIAAVQLQCAVNTVRVIADIYRPPDACLRKTREDLRQIFGKSPVVIMCMCVKNQMSAP